MRDRRYFTSLATFAVVVGVALTGIVCLPLWLGWGGVVGVLTIAGGFLAWFYWGPRPDLEPRGRGGGLDRLSDE